MTNTAKPSTREKRPDAEYSRAYRQKGAAIINTPINAEAAAALAAAVATGLTKRAAVEAALVEYARGLPEEDDASEVEASEASGSTSA